MNNLNRRTFIKNTAIAGMGLGFSNDLGPFSGSNGMKGKRVGIIGLDTSHCTAFTKALNNPDAGDTFGQYKVVAAYPTAGSPDLPASIDRLAGFTEQIRGLGVEIVDSIEALLKKVDVVLLETIDGRKHLEQAMVVIKAGKKMFIDKPIAASLSDAVTIFDAAKRNNVPVFSSSSLRYIVGAEEVAKGNIGKVLGADTYGPAAVEPTHPDLFWYGIHGIEALFAVMGTGCKSVTRLTTENTDMIVGTWEDGRMGSFRGTRYPKSDFGGVVFGEKETLTLGEFKGYNPLLVKIVEFFKTGVVPVSTEETLEIFAFMEAADESKKNGGASVSLETMMQRAKR